MRQETQKFFKAPWKVDKVEFKQDIFGIGSNIILRVFNSDDELITAHVADEKSANQIIRIPELYEALLESIFLINRLTEAWENGMDFGEYCDKCLAEYNTTPSGFTVEWMKLAMDVKDGKDANAI